MKRFSTFNLVSIVLGFAFLYVPILHPRSSIPSTPRGSSRCGAASRRNGMRRCFRNEALLDAAWVTIRVGAALRDGRHRARHAWRRSSLVRRGRFFGRTLFSGMVYAPLVMPEVITGLSLLLLFVAIGFDRGFWTVTLAHITFSMCFVAVVVQSRLVTFDVSLEEAALDLGAPPLKAFFLVTLPVIFPAVAAGWMLAFTLSLDDLVIASFTTGPGATTLPMKIYSQVRLGVTPEINAISTLMIGVVAVGVLADDARDEGPRARAHASSAQFASAWTRAVGSRQRALDREGDRRAAPLPGSTAARCRSGRGCRRVRPIQPVALSRRSRRRRSRLRPASPTPPRRRTPRSRAVIGTAESSAARRRPRPARRDHSAMPKSGTLRSRSKRAGPPSVVISASKSPAACRRHRR